MIKKDRISLSDHFTYRRLLKFVVPAIISMIFTSLYDVVDGLFVSNFVGRIPFAALNLIYPFIGILSTLGFMIGTGGSAVICKTVGEGDNEKACRQFSFLVYFSAGCGVLMGITGILFVKPITLLLGATDSMEPYCVIYAVILLAALPFFILQIVFQSFLIAAEMPRLGLIVTVLAGVSNMILDFLLIVVFKMGIAGAALATGISMFTASIIPFMYFLKENSSLFRLVKPEFDGSLIRRTMMNGLSEMFTNVSLSLMSIIYNLQLLKYAGENGVAAYGVLMYISFIFTAFFYGYSMGVSPIVSYNYGAKIYDEQKNLFRKSLVLTLISGVLMTSISLVFSKIIAEIFVGYNETLLELTTHALILFSFVYVLAGFNIFSSAYFTALNNGIVSGAISFLRVFLFQLISLLVLPNIFGINGIWISAAVGEFLALWVTGFFFLKCKSRYRYM